MLQTTKPTDTFNRFQNSLDSLQSSLRQSLLQVSGLDSELKLLRYETESYKTELLTLKEKCNKQTCRGSEVLNKTVATKDSMLFSVVATLKKYLSTKDIIYINQVLKLLHIVQTDITPFNGSQDKNITPEKTEKVPYESATFTMDVSMDDSTSGIEGTPTGRTSPIIQTKLKSSLSSLLNGTESKEKKKCPENWPTPSKKTTKVATTPSRVKTRLRQQRLNLSKLRTSAVVDLTSSPEFSGGYRGQKTNGCSDVKPIVKQELLATDETILPSPTSAPTIFSSSLYKTLSKESPVKKKPNFKLKRKSDENEKQLKAIENGTSNTCNMEHSINLLNQQPHRFKKPAPVKTEKRDLDETNCEDVPLKDVTELEIKRENNVKEELCKNSPTKRPLAENINISNTDCELGASLSLLHSNDVNNPVSEQGRHTKNTEPVYKEPTVRKKVDKRALPGWSCDDCRIFYDVLYKDDPEMLLKLMNECSKHRGRKNPARPNTPEGFWNPRWSVPDDTEEFNRRNNVE